MKTAQDPSKHGGKQSFIDEHGRLPRPVEDASFDPFRRKVIKITPLTKALHTLAAFILVPLRILIILISVLVSYTLVKIFGPSVTKQSVQQFDCPIIPAWRRRITKFATRLLARGLLLGLGFWTLEGEDDEAYNEEECIKSTVITNHVSLGDPCLLAYLYAPSFVAKTAVYNIPGVGRVGAAHHAFYIDRMHNSRVSLAECIANRQKLVLKEQGALPPVAIFPEGTTTNGEFFIKFKTGAFIAGTPVTPVLLKYSTRYFSPSYESIKTGKYVWGLITQLRNRVRYYRMPVYYPNEAEKKDASLYAQNVYQLMLQKSGEVFDDAFKPSHSNLIDKMEYNSIVRGDKLRRGLKLNEYKA